jgi:hypothetical protein
MKTIKQEIIGTVIILLISAVHVFSQNALQFTSVNVTPEKTIQLHWASNTNEIYQIQYANALATNTDGSTAWNVLYDDYPAQGTNTLWLDDGDYENSSPPVLRPKDSPMRFYRVVLTGTNTSGDNPTVAIISPTSGAVLSSNVTITVSASSDQVLVDTLLYVDGQEMPESDDGSNFVINTSEWLNGPHILFAVAKSQSKLEGLPNDNSVTYGSAASAYVNVTFSNLVSGVSFSQPFFQPSLGQTQEVTANFAANCDWTLQIEDVNSNIVRTATGSGNSLTFDWDGTGDGEASIPDGIYYYLISAATNGESSDVVVGGSSGGGGSPPSPSFARSSTIGSDSYELWAMPADGDGSAVPLALYPPGFDTNGFTVFSATASEVRAASSSLTRTASFETEAATPAYSGPPSQYARYPMRPPIMPTKNALGTFGICYEQYLPDGFETYAPYTGWPYPLPSRVALDGYPVGTLFYLAPLHSFKTVARRFSWALQNGDWKPSFIKANAQFTTSDIEKNSLGGSSIFNNVNIGMLMAHGSYATTPEDDNVKYTYIWLADSQHGIQYLRLSDFDFGGSDPVNGLKWMTIYACSMLNPTCYNSMNNNSKLPVNDNLHLLMGCSTVAYASPKLGNLYGKYLAGSFFTPAQTVPNAWIDSGTNAYLNMSVTNAVNFRVVGWPDCFSDTLAAPNDPDPDDGLMYNDVRVYTP